LNELEVAMMSYLDYVRRRIKEAPEYEPHPIVKAIMLAVAGSENQGDGRYSGIAADSNKEGLHIAVVEKRAGTYTILSLFDAKIGKELGFKVAVVILRISMQLDRFVTEEIPMEDVIKILNDNFPNIRFKHLSASETSEALASFKEKYDQDKIHDIPENMRKLIDHELSQDVKWENRSPEFRALVGSTWGSTAGQKESVFVITNPDATATKHRILDIAKMLMLQSS